MNPNIERAARVIAAAIVHGTSSGVAREVAQALDDARLLVRPAAPSPSGCRTAPSPAAVKALARCPVDGPHRMYVDPIPTGVTLDVEPFVSAVVQDVVELLLTDEFASRFDGLTDAQARDPHLIERPGDLPVESLVADLVAATSTRVPVYGAQVLRLAERLRVLAQTKPDPEQRAEGGAAA